MGVDANAKPSLGADVARNRVPSEVLNRSNRKGFFW